jgi:HlyD family secretion protein
MAHARRTLSRSRLLHASGAATRADLDARETEVSLATEAGNATAFAVRAASAEVERAKARLATFVADQGGGMVMVKAPIDGVVLERVHESENVVQAGAALIEIGDVQQLEIVTNLLSTDAVRVSPGASASIAWGGDSALAATVRRIEPAGFTKISALGVEEQRVNVVLDFTETGEDDAPLGDAYRVDARIVLWEASDVLKVPTSALVRDGDRWAVYVADDGRARRRIIELGRHTGQEAEVRSGLADGTIVLVHPSDLVHDGVRIANRLER